MFGRDVQCHKRWLRLYSPHMTLKIVLPAAALLLAACSSTPRKPQEPWKTLEQDAECLAEKVPLRPSSHSHFPRPATSLDGYRMAWIQRNPDADVIIVTEITSQTGQERGFRTGENLRYVFKGDEWRWKELAWSSNSEDLLVVGGRKGVQNLYVLSQSGVERRCLRRFTQTAAIDADAQLFAEGRCVAWTRERQRIVAPFSYETLPCEEPALRVEWKEQ